MIATIDPRLGPVIASSKASFEQFLSLDENSKILAITYVSALADRERMERLKGENAKIFHGGAVLDYA